MKHSTLIRIIATAIILSACGKDTIPNTAFWYVGTNTYASASVSRQTVSGEFEIQAATGDNGLQLFFASQPATGTYNIVNEQKAGLSTLAANECAISMNVGNGDVYLSTGAGNNTATVTVNSSNKVKVVFPTIPLLRVSTSDTTTGGNGSISEY